MKSKLFIGLTIFMGLPVSSFAASTLCDVDLIALKAYEKPAQTFSIPTRLDAITKIEKIASTSPCANVKQEGLSILREPNKSWNHEVRVAAIRAVKKIGLSKDKNLEMIALEILGESVNSHNTAFWAHGIKAVGDIARASSNLTTKAKAIQVLSPAVDSWATDKAQSGRNTVDQIASSAR